MSLLPKDKQFKFNVPFGISVLLLICSFTQTAYSTDYYDKSASDAPALLEFLIGWTGLSILPYGIPWLANPLLIISWLYFKNKRTSLILSFLAIIFAASFLLYDRMPMNEAPSYANITSIGWGYWLWLLSCISFFLGTLIYARLKIPSINTKSLPNV